MAENNELIKALGQVPELVEISNRILEENDKKFSILAGHIQKRIEAIIPENEIQKIVNEVEATIESTPCATPDIGDSSQLLANRILSIMQGEIKTSIRASITETVQSTPIKLEHVHYHTTLMEMCEMADKKLRDILIFFMATCLTLALILGGIALSYLNSEVFLGKQYREIYTSKYITQTEKNNLGQGCYYVYFLPKEFSDSPQIVKQQIRRNYEIIKQRKKEANLNNGKFSTDIKIER